MIRKKILFATGCSYTDKNYYSYDEDLSEDERGGWKKWPEIMAENLNLKCINTGYTGAGIDYMFTEVIKNISLYGNQIDTIAIMLSTSDRMLFHGYNMNPVMELGAGGWPFEEQNPFQWMNDIGVGLINKKFMENKYFNDKRYKIMIENQLSKILAIIDICKYHNIKYIIAQGTTFFDYEFISRLMLEKRLKNPNSFISESKVINLFIQNPYFSKLDKNKNNILNWPFFSKLGGKTFEDIRFYEYEEKLYISDKDLHPNARCQEIFAEHFLKRYYEIYD